MTTTSSYHDPVLLRESVDALDVIKNGVYVDATMGGGGHTREILCRLGSDGTLFGFDQDEDAGKNVPADERFTWVRHNYRYMKRFLRFYDRLPVHGILADLGVSSHQFDEGDRGFSIRFDGPLDMRMNQSSGLTAAEIINSYSQDEMVRVFRSYGEIRNAWELAKRIIGVRAQLPFTTTASLREATIPLAERGNESQYLARIFQSLRIEVNDELGALKEMLQQAAEVLMPGGKLVVISYHSLEDRLVKNFIAHGKFEGEAEKDIYGNAAQVPLAAITRKPVEPTEEEIARNPRARSAKMRIAVKQ
ncbi:MAG: rRNA ((1402)-N(4))-methyltransferase RsmH [Bacteroidota bacterium]|jgi:16S rRNA (cytosine1402-N4)-methyltransferase